MGQSRNGRLRVPPVRVEELFGRQPPADIDTELHAIQCVFLDDTADGRYAGLIFEALTPEHFTCIAHSLIFEAAKSLHRTGQPAPDFASARSVLDDRGDLERIPDETFSTLQGVAAAKTSAHYYAKRLREIRAKRLLIEAAALAIHAAYEPGAEAEQICADAVESITSLAVEAVQVEAKPLHTAAMSAVEKALSDKPNGINTGIGDLDIAIAPLMGGEMMILAARPGMGKSALAFQIAQNQPAPSVYITHEMTDEQLAMRAVCAIAEIPYRRVTQGKCSIDEQMQLSRAVAQLKSSQVMLLNGAGRTFDTLTAECRKLVQRRGVSLVVVDYLQLVQVASKHDNRQEAVATASHAMKRMAVECNIPVIVVSSVNRESGDAMPTQSHLRESGAIEYDADMILILHREDEFNRRKPGFQPDHKAMVAVEKHRNAEKRIVELQWDGPRMRFGNVQGPPPRSPREIQRTLEGIPT